MAEPTLSTTYPNRPPLDPTLAPILSAFPIPDDLDLDLMRGIGLVSPGEPNPFHFTAETVLSAHPAYTHQEHLIPRPDQTTIPLSIFTPVSTTHQEAPSDPLSPSPFPIFFHIHGGALVSGTRFSGLAETMAFLPTTPCLVVTVEYRLAPETRAPAAAEDCYTALCWLTKHAPSLGADPDSIILYGVSGGGALAASLSLMVRDRWVRETSARIKGVMLHTPMLDDRGESPSDRQFERGSPWCGVSNKQAWDLALGPGVRGSEDVTAWQVPGRAVDLSDLPPMYVDVGECEVFRDQAVRWASDMWRCGSTCELHVWPGVWHIFDMMNGRDVPLVRTAVETKRAWLQRMMSSSRAGE